MPRVKSHTSKKGIYKKGIKIEDPSTKSGFRRDRSQPFDQNDEYLVPPGTKYWTWKFRYGGRKYSLTPPTRRQLTQNAYQLSIYDLEDTLQAIIVSFSGNSQESALEDLKSDLEELLEAQRESLEAMPDHLRETSSSGELLTERIERLEETQTELEDLDFSDYPEDPEAFIGDEAEAYEGETKDKAQEALEEAQEAWDQERISVLESINFN